MGGFVQVARELDGVEPGRHRIPALAEDRDGVVGWITQEAFERFVGRQIEELTAQGGLLVIRSVFQEFQRQQSGSEVHSWYFMAFKNRRSRLPVPTMHFEIRPK